MKNETFSDLKKATTQHAPKILAYFDGKRVLLHLRGMNTAYGDEQQGLTEAQQNKIMRIGYFYTKKDLQKGVLIGSKKLELFHGEVTNKDMIQGGVFEIQDKGTLQLNTLLLSYKDKKDGRAPSCVCQPVSVEEWDLLAAEQKHVLQKRIHQDNTLWRILHRFNGEPHNL